MYKIVFLALISLPLVAGFFPSTFKTSVSLVDGKIIKLKKSLPLNHMSGMLIHSYSKGIRAATTYIVRSNGVVKIVKSDIIHHDKLPTIKTAVKVGDRVIAGYLYNNVLLLAPDAKTYTKVTSKYHKNWIHPDLYAVYLASEGENKPTIENLSSFAKKYKVGLICIVRKNNMILIDPISQKHIATKSISNSSNAPQFPFYNRINRLNKGNWFKNTLFGDNKNINYYQFMESL